MHRTPARHTSTRIARRNDALRAPWSGTRLAPRVIHPVDLSRLPTTTGPVTGQPMELRTPFDVDFSYLVPVRVPRPRSVSETR